MTKPDDLLARIDATIAVSETLAMDRLFAHPYYNEADENEAAMVDWAVGEGWVRGCGFNGRAIVRVLPWDHAARAFPRLMQPRPIQGRRADMVIIDDPIRELSRLEAEQDDSIMREWQEWFTRYWTNS